MFYSDFITILQQGTGFHCWTTKILSSKISKVKMNDMVSIRVNGQPFSIFWIHGYFFYHNGMLFKCDIFKGAYFHLFSFVLIMIDLAVLSNSMISFVWTNILSSASS